jgi:hypothetical protein
MLGRGTLLLALATATTLGCATVIDFEDLAYSGPDMMAPVADGYTSQGYVFNDPLYHGSDAFGVWATWLEPIYPGSTALFNNGSGLTIMSRADQGAFDMISIDLCDDFAPQPPPYWGLHYTGTRADGSTTQNTFTVTDGLHLNTYYFSGMTNIVKLECAYNLDPWVGHQFDNVTMQAVPEPTTISVLGLGALALLRRRRK